MEGSFGKSSVAIKPAFDQTCKPTLAMANDIPEAYVPRSYPGVMVSSTFTDLKKHREALIKAIEGQEMKAIAMENDSAKPDGDVLDSSLSMVRNSASYVGLISHKYGQIPKCSRRNPNNLSLTELEFNEARRLERPVLIFIMGDDHDVKPNDVEQDPEKAKKLSAFRENSKRLREDSTVHRVYKMFNSLEEFHVAATQSIAELRRLLEQQSPKASPEAPAISDPYHAVAGSKHDPIPSPPSPYAEPPYIGSHSFVGRTSQLETLNDWAAPEDSHPILLYEAIGGAGKSMLTWEWFNNHATLVRGNWAGRFWYSFYERGATMVDFCRRALAYMTGLPRGKFRERNTAELTEPLLHQLRDQPWLLVLDGLERVLVSYHRFDAAQMQDEQAGLTDKISDRDPCAAINPEDEDLLRSLSAASPSKLLLTSRLAPRPLLNRSGQPIPGVLRERLPGLRPADAEQLIRSCGVNGTSENIQAYLKTHCDCHPLVTGVLAGLITDYLPDKGNFDAWVIDAQGGGTLNFANLDLVQKRNHILSVALKALPEKGRQLLSTLALLSESVDYSTLTALNPSLSPIPESVEQPKDPSIGPKWKRSSAEERKKALDDYQKLLFRRAAFDEAIGKRESEIKASAQMLDQSIRDLERRGLLQYDHGSKRYDLHPVVRGIAAGGLKHEEKSHYGQRVVDHFSQQAHDPYELAESLEDFDNVRLIVKALFQMGKKRDARHFIHNNNFINVLDKRFEAHNEILSIVRPFFSEDWTSAPMLFDERGGIGIASIAAIALRRIGAFREAFTVSETAILKCIQVENWFPLCTQLLSLSSTAGEQNRLALEDRLMLLAFESSNLNIYNNSQERRVKLSRFRQLTKCGKFDEADLLWEELSKLGFGDAEAIAAHHRAVYLFFRGNLTEEELLKAETNQQGSALGTRNLLGLRGFWYLDNDNWEQAKQSLQQAVALARKAGKIDRRSEIRLALAKAKLQQLDEPEQVAEQFSQDRNLEAICYRPLAELWMSIGHREESLLWAKKAYVWAWADGEPYTNSYELTKTSKLVQRLRVESQITPQIDRDSFRTLPVEKEVLNAIRELKRRQVWPLSEYAPSTSWVRQLDSSPNWSKTGDTAIP